MRYHYTPFVLLILITTLSACAPQEQVSFLEKRISTLSVKDQALEKEIKLLKAELQTLKEASGPDKLFEMNRRQAEFQNRLDEINAELLRISGMIEEMKHTYSSQQEREQALIQALQQDVTRLRQELRVLGSAKATREEANKKVEAAKKSGIDQYQKGLDLIKAKKYKEARLAMEQYIKEFPNGKLIPNALFWIGECEYNLNRYEEAILAFEKVVKDYPKSNKAPAALLKEGMAFFKLGDPESAKIIWRKLIKQYPKSSQAQVARKQLKRLGR